MLQDKVSRALGRVLSRRDLVIVERPFSGSGGHHVHVVRGVASVLSPVPHRAVAIHPEVLVRLLAKLVGVPANGDCVAWPAHVVRQRFVDDAVLCSEDVAFAPGVE